MAIMSINPKLLHSLGFARASYVIGTDRVGGDCGVK